MKVSFLAMLFNVTVFPILPFILKYRIMPLHFMIHIFLAVGCIGSYTCALMNGSLHSSILPWLSLLPVISVLLNNRSSGIIWLVINIIAIIICSIIDKFTLTPAIEIQAQLLNYFTTGNLVGLSLILFFLVLVFENTKNQALQSLDDKNALLDTEKKHSEQMLLNILPSEVVAELKDTGVSKAKHFENVTVLFTDFVDFTYLSQELSPEELVGEIDSYFKDFDAIIESYGLEKIKTIGDAYLAVSGLPVEKPDSAVQAVNCAIALLQYVSDRINNGGRFNVRIGINSGPLVAGIVGVKKFAYDIWGDTVNTASRMESSGEPGKINISQQTFNLVKDEFSFDYRGKIGVKGKGEIDMYFIKIS